MTPNIFTHAGIGVADALRGHMPALPADSGCDGKSTLFVGPGL
jgi:hypothetical protein